MNENRIRLDADKWSEDIDRLVSDHYGNQGHDSDWLRAFGEGLIRAADRRDDPEDGHDDPNGDTQ